MINKAVLFDLDGTLLNTSYDLMNAANHSMDYAGSARITLDETIQYAGNGNKNLVRRALKCESDDPRLDNIFKEFMSFYQNHCMNETYVYPSMMNIIEELKNRGYKVAVVSNKADYLAKKIINNYFGDIFDIVIGARDNVPIKPAPDLVYLALKELDVERENAYFIGDSQPDCETARNAGLKYYIFTDGFRTRQFLEEKGIDNLIDNRIDILNYIK